MAGEYRSLKKQHYYIYIGLIMLIIACISQINKAAFIIFSD